MDNLVKLSPDMLTFDHERAFMVRAKGVRSLGLWAAGRLGLTGLAAKGYARALVDSDFGKTDDEAILRPLLRDLKPLGIKRAELVDRLIECIEQAWGRHHSSQSNPLVVIAQPDGALQGYACDGEAWTSNDIKRKGR